MTFRLRHLVAALVLHALLLGVLAGGLQCTRKPTKPPVINAVLLDPDRKEVAAQKKRSAEEQRRRLEQERKAAEQERKRLEAEKRKQVAEEQKRRQAEEFKKREADRKQQAIADAQKKKADEARRQKELAEKKKADDLARKKQQEDEQRERQEAAKRELQEKARLEEELRREEIAREAELEQEARAASERQLKQAQWADALSRHVVKYWNRPGGTPDFSCEVRVQLLPDGTVTSARVVTSCGNSALDQSVEDAVFRASPMPKPADASVFDRNLNFIFKPR